MHFSHLHRYMALEHPEVGEAFTVQPEEQNSDYQSGLLTLSGETWRIRSARITPTKPGGFVAMWTRDISGEARPFHTAETLAETLVFVEDGRNFGVFRFTPSHLEKLGYVTVQGELVQGSYVQGTVAQSGKRGFRVYPSWCVDLNPQATRTQKAQASAFTQYS